MPFTPNFRAAARRHFEATNDLREPASHRRDVAGYLYGLSAEMAVKAMMLNSVLRTFAGRPKYENPFFAHFPELKTLLREKLEGRAGGPLLKIAEDPRLMQNWGVEMRYAASSDIDQRWIARWEDQARDLLGRMDCQ